MKLKKFAAMMLAGVMAVSMLAGCSGKSTNGGNGDDGVVVEPSSSSIVTAFNNGQDKDNKVKINFTSDSKLDTVLEQAVKACGATAALPSMMGEAAVKALIPELNGVSYSNLCTNFAQATDKESLTMLGVKGYTSDAYWTESDALNAAAREINDYIATLLLDNRDKTAVGQKYTTFSYTGHVSMVTYEDPTGATAYYVAYTITQTAAQQEVVVK